MNILVRLRAIEAAYTQHDASKQSASTYTLGAICGEAADEIEKQQSQIEALNYSNGTNAGVAGNYQHQNLLLLQFISELMDGASPEQHKKTVDFMRKLKNA